MSRESESRCTRRIEITWNGPYLVYGGVPLVAKTQVVSDYGEPLAWKKVLELDTSLHELCQIYSLCRCGRSSAKPFCDGTHRRMAFDGTETSDTRPMAERQAVYVGNTQLMVWHDDTLCAGSGFCATRQMHLRQLARQAAEAAQFIQIVAMVEHCPSGSLTYAPVGHAMPVEPDLPQQIAVTTEITATGSVAGPLWVTGFLPVERADGRPFETRNRVTLCCCGRSHHKPLCDGTHRDP
jgi:CDGSH-type Zn-finger protein